MRHFSQTRISELAQLFLKLGVIGLGFLSQNPPSLTIITAFGVVSQGKTKNS